ncbi:histidinol dehydrogenase [Aeoliella sp. ICT_H6.2]|uniref:Histidinol dehydrogenase n=1 Tax=Aeoliella straminimaris TaxID=2954799 RepID=A0A9X2FAM1_9BACT|nr:histidinol dehydrogenase [Aeoliella straminimaris]MCO6045467.1 histidinol dehydrogenase [Aeoliella straminimaris]
MLRIDTSQPDARRQIDSLRAKLAPSSGDVVSEAGRKKTIEVFGEPLTPVEVVDRICRDIRERGLEAVLEYTAKLDGAELTAETLRVPQAELEAAHQAADDDFLACIRRIRENVMKFQSAILHSDTTVPLESGGWLRQRYLPIERAGLCIPGGAAAYPSTVLMTALPAQAAGVKELVVVAPPTPFGSYNQDLLATCHELGIREVYRMGGAQAVAALAYGIASPLPRPTGQEEQVIVKVDKIVGPGNLFVALAKKQVFGDVDIDSIAGPSEVIVIADETTNAEWTAADLLAQAEHSPGSSVMITWHAPLIDEVEQQVETQLAELSRSDLTRQSLDEFGALILVRDREEAAELADTLATEHLHITCNDPEEMLDRIRAAGAVFLGPHAPVAVGDYAAGPSHVLPTGATARFASGLSSNDFLRTNSVISYTEANLKSVAGDVLLMADKEGLTAHAASVARRTK